MEDVVDEASARCPREDATKKEKTEHESTPAYEE